MKTYLLFIWVLFGLFACETDRPVQAQWMNARDSIQIQDFEFQIKTEDQNLDAYLYTSTQPIDLIEDWRDGYLFLRTKHGLGISEGPAELILTEGANFLSYSMQIKNKDYGMIDQKDYRSSKSIHVDSSLLQQSIRHRIDAYRNLHCMEDGKYFNEENLKLSAKAGTYRADPEKALSAYYVLPGMSAEINITANYIPTVKSYKISTNTLLDSYGNILPDGTLLTFIIQQSGKTTRIEKVLLNGQASIWIPAYEKGDSRIIAMIDKVISEPLELGKL